MESPKSESTESLLNEWMCLARHNKRMHEEAAVYYKKYADTSMISAVVLGSTGGILNIVLGAIDPVSFLFVNVAQVCLGAVGLVSTGIVSVSKRLELEKNTIMHLEYAAKYSELHRMIRSELVLLRMDDSSYASKTDFLKTCQNELNRIEESAPSIPAFIGEKCTVSPTSSPRTSRINGI